MWPFNKKPQPTEPVENHAELIGYIQQIAQDRDQLFRELTALARLLKVPADDLADARADRLGNDLYRTTMQKRDLSYQEELLRKQANENKGN